MRGRVRLCLLLLVLVALAACVPDPPPPLWSRKVLGTLGGTTSEATAINKSGVVVGWSLTAGDDAIQAFRWSASSGALVAIPGLGGSGSSANDINDDGVIVGTATVPGDLRMEAFVYDPSSGTSTGIGTLGGSNSAAIAVNNAGIVVGYSDLPGDEETAAFRWDPSTGTMESLGSLGGSSQAFDINDAGVVVGETERGDDPAVAFRWTESDGMNEIPTGAAGSTAYGINAAGVVTGAMGVEGSPDLRTFRWRPGDAVAAEVATVGGGDAGGEAITDAGLVVGQTAFEPFSVEAGPDAVEPDIGFVAGPGADVAYSFESTAAWSSYRDANAKFVVGGVWRGDGQGSRAVVQRLSGTPTIGTGAGALLDADLSRSVLSGDTATDLAWVLGALMIASVPAGVRRRRRTQVRGATDGHAREPVRARTLAALTLLGVVAALLPSPSPATAAVCNCDEIEDQLADSEAERDALAGPLGDALDNVAEQQAAHDAAAEQASRLADVYSQHESLRSRIENARAVGDQALANANDEIGADSYLWNRFDDEVEGKVVPRVEQKIDQMTSRYRRLNDLNAAYSAPEQARVASKRMLQMSRTAKYATKVISKYSPAKTSIELAAGYYDLASYTAEKLTENRLWDEKAALPMQPSLNDIAQAATQRDAAAAALQAAQDAAAPLQDAYDEKSGEVEDLQRQLDDCRQPCEPPDDPLRNAAAEKDPHLYTFDGLAYDLHADGEFWLVRSAADDFGVQMRSVFVGGRNWVAVIDAVGVVTPGGHRVLYEDDAVRVDGDSTLLPITLDDGAVVDTDGVVMPDGTQVEVETYEWGGLFYDVTPRLPESRWGEVAGLLGDADGAVANDAATPQGDVVFGPDGLAGPAGTAPLYEEFAPSWLVAPADRVFGGNVRPYVPPETEPPRSFDERELALADAECAAAGIDDQTLRKACVFDRVAIGLPPPTDVDPRSAPTVVANAGNTPTLDPLPSSARIATSENHTCAIVPVSGVVKCWGSNWGGQLGSGTGDSTVPVEVLGLGGGIRAVAAGGNHSCAITAAGGLKCWGANGQGQLGDGTTVSTSEPTAVIGLDSGVIGVTAGLESTCALLATGAVKCWGANGYGQVGDGTNEHRTTPQSVVGLSSGVVEIDSATGGFLPGSGGWFGEHVCARTAAGAVACWGRNTHGQLGDGATIDRWTPVTPIGLGTGVIDISAGGLHSCAVRSTGVARCWGEYSNLGSGEADDSPVPVDVVGVTDARTVDGDGMSCVQRMAGAIKCWGYEGPAMTATDIAGIDSDDAALAVGSGHACVLKRDDSIWCWGRNGYGQLGTGSYDPEMAPTRVVGF